MVINHLLYGMILQAAFFRPRLTRSILEAFLDAASGGHVDVLRSLVSWLLGTYLP